MTKADNSNLRFYPEAGFVFLYETATTSFHYLPPLIGLFFAYIVIEYHSKIRKLERFGLSWYASIVFLIFAEQIHGFYLFSSILAFLIFYNFIFDWLFVSLKWRSGLLVIFVAAGYLLSYGISCLFYYMQTGNVFHIGFEYALFIFVESILAIVFLKSKLL